MYFNDMYISWIIIVSSIGIIISLMCFLLGIRNEDWTIAGYIIGALSLFIGFGVLSNIIPVKEEKHIILNYETAYTSTTVSVVMDNYSKMFYDVKTYNLLKNPDSCVIYYLVKYNSYGFEVESPTLIIDKKY